MNPHHFRAFLWLRWRIRVNQLRRSGTLATVIVTVLAAAAVLLAGVLLIGSFLVGLLALDRVPPGVRLLIWDGLTVAFLFGWLTGLLTELQRTESLALDKFLHLPVSLSGAFLINYLATLASFTLLLFVPAATGLILGETFRRGPAMLLGLPLLLSFVFAVTALTYLFQGWLAGLMANPRRRRTVIVLLTLGFILISQLPNLLNLARPWEAPGGRSIREVAEEQQTLTRELLAGTITQEEYDRRTRETQRVRDEKRQEESRRRWEESEQSVRLLNAVLPPGWLPLGVADLAAGNVVPALLGTAGLALIGAAGLWRAYRSTLRMYTGSGRAGGAARPAAPRPADRPPGGERPRLVEWRLPGVPEAAAAVALAGFRSLLRAPETKMMLLTPFIFVIIFGSMVVSGRFNPPGPVRPLLAFGGTIMVLLTSIQLAGNQFGYDRGGFRAFVLSPVPRREVLLGKNLAIAPLTLGLTGLAVVAVQAVYPMRLDHFLAAFVQLGSTFLLFCLLANLLSILGPIPIAAGSFKPASTRLVPVLLHMVFLALFPSVLAPTLLPLGIEFLLAEFAGVRGWPVALLLSAVLFLGVQYLYRTALTWEGRLLAAREQAILEVVTSKSE